jgi:hypothetical protein
MITLVLGLGLSFVLFGILTGALVCTLDHRRQELRYQEVVSRR